MAVGTGESANQLHIYHEKGGGIKAGMGEGLVSESGWGGHSSMPHPRLGRALLEHKGRATSQ